MGLEMEMWEFIVFRFKVFWFLKREKIIKGVFIDSFGRVDIYRYWEEEEEF